MANNENEKILESARLLERWENTPAPWEDPYSDMSDIEKSKLILYLMEQREEQRKREESQQKQIAELMRNSQQTTEKLDKYIQQISALMNQICELTRLLKQKDQEISDLKSRLKLGQRIRYSKTSQKRSSRKKDDDDKPTPHTDAESGFDGSEESLPENMDVDTPEESSLSKAVSEADAALRLYRQGQKYRTMTADNHVEHLSDRSLLPEGAEFIKYFTKTTYDQVTIVTEHRYQMILYKDKDGKMQCGYFPSNGTSPIIENVPGTHASPDFLSYLVFDRFFLDTPVYREKYRLLQEKMRLSRQTISNWLFKGSSFIKFIIDELKAKCLEKDSIVNCDETWCRVKVNGEYKKKYIWCLVNKKSKTVIYCYEDGSRRRDVLKHILGDSQIKALQTDGYAAYLYLDKDIVDIEHLCCMAHVRAKFLYALEIEHDETARQFLKWIEQLYLKESYYERMQLSPHEIKVLRNSQDTEAIKQKMREKLDLMLSDCAPGHGDLMRRAVKYLDHFWNQVFLYQRDGEYTIDNNLAERFIRPLTNERKNSLFFGSHKMARVSAAYHSVISTCCYHGISILEYLKKFFTEIVAGNRDYQKLMPSTIGISANKL